MVKFVFVVLVGNLVVFVELCELVGMFSSVVNNLCMGQGELVIVLVGVQLMLELFKFLVECVEKNGKVVQVQEKILIQVGQVLCVINCQFSDLLESVEVVFLQVLQINVFVGEVFVVGQFVMLIQCIGKSVNEFLMQEGVSFEVVFLFGKDLNFFKFIIEVLISGSFELCLNVVCDLQFKECLQILFKQYEQMCVQVLVILGNL